MPDQRERTSAYTRINLDDIEDAAVSNGVGHRWEARVARVPRDNLETGLTHFEAGPDGLKFLATGPHYPGDGQPVDDPWVG